MSHGQLRPGAVTFVYSLRSPRRPARDSTSVRQPGSRFRMSVRIVTVERLPRSQTSSAKRVVCAGAGALVRRSEQSVLGFPDTPVYGESFRLTRCSYRKPHCGEDWLFGSGHLSADIHTDAVSAEGHNCLEPHGTCEHGRRPPIRERVEREHASLGSTPPTSRSSTRTSR